MEHAWKADVSELIEIENTNYKCEETECNIEQSTDINHHHHHH